MVRSICGCPPNVVRTDCSNSPPAVSKTTLAFSVCDDRPFSMTTLSQPGCRGHKPTAAEDLSLASCGPRGSPTPPKCRPLRPCRYVSPTRPATPHGPAPGVGAAGDDWL